MMHSFSDFTIGDVFVAPFVSYAAMALIILLVLRPVFRRCGLRNSFSHPAVAELGFYVTILGLLTVAF